MRARTNHASLVRMISVLVVLVVSQHRPPFHYTAVPTTTYPFPILTPLPPPTSQAKEKP